MKRAPFDGQIGFLRLLLREIKTWIGEQQEKQEITVKRISDKIFYGFIDVTKEMAKPAEKQQNPVSPKPDPKGNPSQFIQSRILESLNGKRRRVDNETQETDLCEKIGKIMKKHSEIHQSNFCSFEQEISQKSQPERVKMEELDEKQILHYC